VKCCTEVASVFRARHRNPALRRDWRVDDLPRAEKYQRSFKTGRILAMSGGFSYPLSQLNRVTQAQRQPGSAIKPLTTSQRSAKAYSQIRW
jgi:penicillin-binding protein 1A